MENSKAKQFLIDSIEENSDVFCNASMEIWENPELAMQEYFAQEKLTKLLEDNGFKVEKGVAGLPTSFVAEYGEGRPVIGFSAEFDALPGLSQKNDSNFHDPVQEGGPGHGCGHNLLAVGGLQAAIALKKLMETEGIKGTLKVFGTPAEEICVGKPFMARAGYFEGLDALVDWHPGEKNLAGYKSCLAYVNVKYHFTGKAAHGNAPWMGVSALDAAMLMGHAIELMREHVDPGPEDGHTTINYAFPDRGNAYPVVVPDKSTLWVVGRFYKAEILEDVLERIRSAAEGCAKATGTTVEEEFITATHNMIPNKVIGETMDANFAIIGPPPFSEEDNRNAKEVQESIGCEPSGFRSVIEPISPGNQPVTDSSEYSWFAPMCLANVMLSPSIECSGHNWAVCRLAGSEIGMKTAVTAAKLLSLTAYDLLTDADLLNRAQEEHRQRLGGQVYKTMLPEGCEPDVNINKDLMEKFKILKK